jgi:hypothetical protein
MAGLDRRAFLAAGAAAGVAGVVVQAVAAATELVWPPGAREDELSGGGDAIVVPKGSVALGDYVLYRAVQAEVVIQRFAALTALREGRVLRRWPILARPG